jgi:HSP20 family protein
MFGIVPFRNNKIQERGSTFDMDSIFSDFFNDSFLGFANVNTIKADIKETDKEFIIDAEIPGANKEDIKLELKDDRLTIAVEKSVEKKEERDNYIRRERRCGSYSRSFYVENVKNEDVTAKYENGILSIVLPKSETKKIDNRIDIQ